MTWKPSRTLLNVVIDAVGLLLMLSMVFTGALIRFVLPPGSTGRHGGRGLTLWGMDRHDWGSLHFWLAVAVLALLLLHVALHWSWVCGLWRRWRRSTDASARGARVISGLAFLLGLVLLLGGLIWWSAARVHESVGSRPAREPPSNPMRSQRSTARDPEGVLEKRAQVDPASTDPTESDVTVRGFMTLREVADATGVPVDHLKSSLNLPSGTSDRERLGRLRRRFGFQMEAVWRAIATYRKLRAGEG